MFGFSRRKKKTIEIPKRDEPDGLYQAVWERKRLPSPGAQRYSYESLALQPYSPIGASVATRTPLNPLAGPQPFVGQAVALSGIPTTAGQLVGQPLFDPKSGYGRSSYGGMNNPFPFSSQPEGGNLL